MDQQDAVGEGDRGPRVSWRDDRDLGHPDLDGLGVDAHRDTAFQHLKRHAATLITLVEVGAGAERDEDQPEGSGFGERATVPVALGIFLFRAQPGSLLYELEM
jgi:hypothetical protein